MIARETRFSSHIIRPAESARRAIWPAVLSMFEAGRPCVDLAQQLHAVESAMSNAKRD